MRPLVWMRLPVKLKSVQPKGEAVDQAGRWEESHHPYPGRSVGTSAEGPRAEETDNHHHEMMLILQKSAEVIVSPTKGCGWKAARGNEGPNISFEEKPVES